MSENLHPHRDAFAEALVGFLDTQLPVLHPKAAGHAPWTRTMPLFEEGGIDSLGIIHIVAFVESAIEKPLPLQEISMKNFRTVEDIANLFEKWRGS